MKAQIFAIYDSKAESYLQPLFSTNNQTALRQFTQACQDEESNFNRHAADYTLFAIGEFDDQTGNIKGYEAKTNLGCAIEYIGEKKDNG